MDAETNWNVDEAITSYEEDKSFKKPLSPQQLAWIDFTATQGLTVLADGSTSKMTVRQFSEEIGIPLSTLYYWRESIPDFWQLVAERVMHFYSGNRTVKMINAIFLAGTSKLDVRAQQLWMANQKLVEFRMPTQEVKHEAGDSWAALMAAHRERKPTHNVIEGETVDATDTDVIR